MDYLGRIAAANGNTIVNDATEYEGRFDSIYFAEATVVARIEVDGVTATDEKATYITNPATAVVGGITLTPKPPHKFFSAITLTSGSVVTNNK